MWAWGHGVAIELVFVYYYYYYFKKYTFLAGSCIETESILPSGVALWGLDPAP